MRPFGHGTERSRYIEVRLLLKRQVKILPCFPLLLQFLFGKSKFGSPWRTDSPKSRGLTFSSKHWMRSVVYASSSWKNRESCSSLGRLRCALVSAASLSARARRAWSNSCRCPLCTASRLAMCSSKARFRLSTVRSPGSSLQRERTTCSELL